MDAAKTDLYRRFGQWIDKPAAYPLADGGSLDDEEPVWIFRWDEISAEEQQEQLDVMFNDCDPIHYNDICTVTPEKTPHGTVHTWRLKANWLPFALTMVDVEGAIEWASEEHGGGFPEFAEMLFVNLDEYRDDGTAVYRLDIDGTAMPRETIERYSIDLGGMRLVAPASQE